MTAPRPQLAVSAAIFRNGRCLIVRRTRPPLDVYTLPGGRVEFGESLEAATQREIVEETGLAIAVLGLAGWREVLPAVGGDSHYVILSFAARWRNGDITLNEELAEARWLPPQEIAALPTTPGLLPIIAEAARLAG